MLQQHRLPWRQLLPAFISRQRLSTEDGDHIIRSGELGEINTQIIIRQRGAMEGVTILQGYHPLGGLADAGNRAVGPQGKLGYTCSDRREGRRGVFAEEAHPQAIWIEAGQAPTIAMVTGGTTPTGEARVQRLDWPKSSSQRPPLLAKKVLSTVSQPPNTATVKGLGTGAKRLLTSCHT